MSVALRSAACGSMRWRKPIERTPAAEDTRPAMTMTRGSSIIEIGFGSAEPMAMAATMEPT